MSDIDPANLETPLKRGEAALLTMHMRRLALTCRGVLHLIPPVENEGAREKFRKDLLAIDRDLSELFNSLVGREEQK